MKYTEGALERQYFFPVIHETVEQTARIITVPTIGEKIAKYFIRGYQHLTKFQSYVTNITAKGQNMDIY
jgi:hypothetical protein